MLTRRLQEREENSIMGADVVDGHLVLRRYDGSTLKVNVDLNAIVPQVLVNWAKVSEIDFASGVTGNDYAIAPQYPSHNTGDLLIVFAFGRNNAGMSLSVPAGFTSAGPVVDPYGNGQLMIGWKKATSNSESGLVIGAGRPGVWGVFMCYRNTNTHDAVPYISYEGSDGIANSGTADADSLQLLFGWAADDFDYPAYLAATDFNVDAQYNVDGTVTEAGKQTFVVMSKEVSGAFSSVEVAPFHMSQGQILFNAIIAPSS